MLFLSPSSAPLLHEYHRSAELEEHHVFLRNSHGQPRQRYYAARLAAGGAGENKEALIRIT